MHPSNKSKEPGFLPDPYLPAGDLDLKGRDLRGQGVKEMRLALGFII
jgi:hypothetical protein